MLLLEREDPRSSRGNYSGRDGNKWFAAVVPPLDVSGGGFEVFTDPRFVGWVFSGIHGAIQPPCRPPSGKRRFRCLDGGLAEAFTGLSGNTSVRYSTSVVVVAGVLGSRWCCGVWSYSFGHMDFSAGWGLRFHLIASSVLWLVRMRCATASMAAT